MARMAARIAAQTPAQVDADSDFLSASIRVYLRHQRSIRVDQLPPGHRQPAGEPAL
jgi:hypothetical protein